MQDEPVIEAIEDIGNDQGGAVRITVRRSGRDRLGSATPVLQYEVYRRIDPLPLGHSREASTGSMLSDPGTLLQGWDYVGAFPAHLEPHYYTVAPTLADSTISNGMHWSVFFVRAATADPGVFVDSEPDSGYSLDNLAPAAPPAFNMTSPTELAWEEVSDEDFNYYAVYGSEGPAMDGSETLIGFTTDIQMDVTGSVFAYYHVTAFDFSGNEGDASTLENTHAGVSAGSLPTEYALMQNLPNPFDAATSIRFDLPGASHVRLIVFDVEGRGVVKLTDGVWEAGQHSVVWGGDDSDGKPASPGLYFVRMEAPGFVDTKKMILMR
jgi:hypothetical protein